MTRYSTGSIWVRHSCTSARMLKIPCKISKIFPTWKVLPRSIHGRLGLGRYGCVVPLRGGFWGGWAGGGVLGCSGGSSEKNAELSTSMGAVSSEPSLRLMCRRER